MSAGWPASWQVLSAILTPSPRAVSQAPPCCKSSASKIVVSSALTRTLPLSLGLRLLHACLLRRDCLLGLGLLLLLLAAWLLLWGAFRSRGAESCRGGLDAVSAARKWGLLQCVDIT